MVEVNGFNFTPIPIGTSAQDWARIINQRFSVMDYHNHTLNYGLNIDSQSLGVGTLFANNQLISHISELSFVSGATSGGAPYCLYVNVSGDLYYQNPTVTTQLTSGSSLNIANIAQGFTVSGSNPVAIFDPTVLGVRFESASGKNTSTISVGTINCTSITNSSAAFTIYPSVSAPSIPANTLVTNSGAAGNFRAVTLPGTSFSNIPSTYNAWQNAPIYKLSENGAFYYDNQPYSPANSYAIQYFYGAKNWISSPTTNRGPKTGAVQYYMKTVSFALTGLFVSETFVLDDNLENSNLVSFIPKVSTTTVMPIGQNSGILQGMTLPQFTVLFSENTLSVAVNLDFTSYTGIIDTVTLNFKIIYANTQYTVVN